MAALNGVEKMKKRNDVIDVLIDTGIALTREHIISVDPESFSITDQKKIKAESISNNDIKLLECYAMIINKLIDSELFAPLLADTELSLAETSKILGITRERVRQIQSQCGAAPGGEKGKLRSAKVSMPLWKYMRTGEPKRKRI